jgi:hypothetical protein
MSLPASFSGMPQEQLHHHFRNTCIEFKKVAKASKDINDLEIQMDRFMNVCKGINWPQHNSDVFHKNQVEKSINKVISEYKRYLNALQNNPENAHSQDLIHAITEVGNLFENLKV